jgi:hypothetical protein
LGSTAPEHALRYVPTGLEDVAVVEHVGAVVRDAAVSPFTKPEYEAVMVGTVPPYVIEPDEALIESGAGPEVTEPAT